MHTACIRFRTDVMIPCWVFERNGRIRTVSEHEELNRKYNNSGVNRIEAFVETPNKVSRSLLEKLGFRMEGTLREHEMCRGKLIDIQLLSLLRKEWKQA